ncbi:MAG: phage holin family protein [Thermoanaerobaculia bacterium]|nr:phage holin family protein [Thermoanaerobaculia bacterium]
MLQLLIRIVLNGIALLVAAYVVPGVHWSGGIVALLIAGAILGLINGFIRPLVTLLSLPLLVLTLGLFYLLINGAMLALVAKLAPGLEVQGCLPAIIGAIIVGCVNWAMEGLRPGDD